MTILKIIYVATILLTWFSFLHRCIYVHNAGRKFSFKLIKAIILMLVVSLIPILNISVSNTLFNDDLCESMMKD
jgi:hypothetical protein